MADLPTAFLDRDSIINEEVGFVNHEDRFHLIPGIVEAIRKLKEAGVLCVVVTNQPGVGLGVFPESLVIKIHQRLQENLSESAVTLDGIYYCPHHEQVVPPAYRRQYPNRKPGTGMIEQAASDPHIDLKCSYMVGNRGVDIEMAGRADLCPILVETGYGKGEWLYRHHTWNAQPTFVAKNLNDAARWIVADKKRC